METKEKIQNYYNRYLSNEITKEELEEFLQLIQSPEHELTVFTLMDGTWEEMFANEKAVVVAIRKPRWHRLAAAAAILTIVLFGGYFILKNNSSQEIAKLPPDLKNDIAAPTNNKARITLIDGNTISLDSFNNGILAMQKNVQVVKNANGDITYQSTSGGQQAELQFNTLTNPRGSKAISLTLSDGTQVWLNAESSLKYPIFFFGKERRVEITGEGYFAVEHNEKMPFKVIANGMEVHDIGTEFNVNAYSVNPVLRTTLIKGLAKVVNGTDIKLLTPGQQAQVAVDVSGIVINTNVDLEEVMSWKNGKFHFSNTDIKELMQEISRWYDVDVNFLSNTNMRFGGKMDRNSSLMQVLKILEESGVRFKLEGKTLTIL